jgi:tRNA(fMet)-specific endonuclease VapC
LVLYILDTDHFTLYRRFHPLIVERIRQTDVGALAITAVTVEEQVNGWLSEIRKASAKSANQGERLSWAYSELCQTVQIVSRFRVLNFTVGAHDRFLGLRSQGVRIGTQDLRIASVALDTQAVIVTRNRRDFEQVPGLSIEDWSLA